MSNENQHWVPKFLVKNFAGSDGRVFGLNIHSDEITKLPPKRAASSIGFYEFQIGGKTVSFEDELGKIEAQAAPILKRIVSSRSVALTAKQRKRVANFMAAQSFRTEAFYKGLELGSPQQQFGPIFAQLWCAFLVSAALERRQWVVMAIDHDDVFYLGDHPVVLQHTEKPGGASELGFDIQGVEAFLPLAPKCALYMPCLSISEQIVSGYESAVSKHRGFRSAALRRPTTTSIHSGLLQLSQRVMRQSQPLYQALTTGAALTAIPENVENLNYLQCVFAHMAVYSNRRDFAFAKRVLHESPQYRKTPKARLAMVEAR